MRKLFLVPGFVCLFQLAAFSQLQFNSFEAFINYASQQSIDLRKKDIEISEAKKARIVSLLDAFDPTGNVSLGYKNNIRLPVTLIPSELLGGNAGSFEEVQFGLQYETQFALSGELKLFNLSGWQSIEHAKLNALLKDTEKSITRKDLYENLATVYYNILTLQRQKEAIQRNLQIADTIQQNVLMRFEKGLIKQQDVNEAKINYMTLMQSALEITYSIQQQYQALKIISDLPEKDSLAMTEQFEVVTSPDTIAIEENDLQKRQAELREKLALVNLRKQKYTLLPTLSLSYFNSKQQFNENSTLFDNNVNWIPSSYIGFRLVMPLPSYQHISQQVKARYDYLRAQQTSLQTSRKANMEAQQLQTNYRKAVASMTLEKSIYELKKDSFEKNYLNYAAGLITLNDALKSFQDMVNAEYRVLASVAAVKLATQNIKIRNEIN